MKITLVMVASVNGKITRKDNPDVRAWNSEEDAELFLKLKQKFPLIFMGRRTYEAAKKNIQLDPAILRIVFTHHPELYKNVPGQLEFTSETPTALVTRLSAYKEALLVGGSEINALFLNGKLVNEIHLTIEPVLQDGKNLVEGLSQNTSLQLVSIQQLNELGTLYCIYKVL